jgi:hypothetical protein
MEADELVLSDVHAEVEDKEEKCMTGTDYKGRQMCNVADF